MDKTTQTGNRIVLCGISAVMLASMLWTIVKAYLAGGPEAPTLTILLLAIAVLGGGIAFAVVYGLSLLKKYPAQRSRQEEDAEKSE